MKEKNLLSRLETYDMESGQRKVLKEFQGRIEAPNWTRDGKSLVYNSLGNIYLFNLDTRKSVQIHTGDCTSCTRDHVLSADGRSLAISSGCNESKVSRVWVLPIGGGWPKLITERFPSHVHGWSPDGTKLAFRALRNGKFNIYAIGVQEHADEVALTDGADEPDGPEFSPDGHYVWFHSFQSGHAQIRRMKTDGSQQAQLTFDDGWNSCFAHVSPNGRHVVYLSYRRDDTALDNHNVNRNGEIRLTGNEGGKTTSLIELIGGEGTMDVNSWSPDSRKFAFVSYRDGGLG